MDNKVPVPKKKLIVVSKLDQKFFCCYDKCQKNAKKSYYFNF